MNIAMVLPLLSEHYLSDYLGINLIVTSLAGQGHQVECVDLNEGLVDHLLDNPSMLPPLFADRMRVAEQANSPYHEYFSRYVERIGQYRDAEALKRDLLYDNFFRNAVVPNFSLARFQGLAPAEVYRELDTAIPVLKNFLLSSAGTIAGKGTDAILISVPHVDQFVPGLLFGKAVKAKNPEAFVVFGGSTITLTDDVVLDGYVADGFFDAYIKYSGEEKLGQLLDDLDEGLPVDQEALRQQAYVEIDTQKVTYRPEMEKTSVPVLYSRGCYWGKCSYCTYVVLDSGRFTCKNLDVLMDELDTFSGEPVRISLITEALTPRDARRIAQAIIDRHIRIHWGSFMRVDTGFDAETFRLLKRSGCIFACVGVEAANDNTLKFYEKGYKRRDVISFFEAAREADFRFFQVNFMYGAPLASLEDELETLEHISAFRDTIANIAFFRLEITKKSKLGQNLEQYHIKTDPASSRQAIRVDNIPFVTNLTGQELQLVERAYAAAADFFINRDLTSAVATAGQHGDRRVQLSGMITFRQGDHCFLGSLRSPMIREIPEPTFTALSSDDNPKVEELDRDLLMSLFELKILQTDDLFWDRSEGLH